MLKIKTVLINFYMKSYIAGNAEHFHDVNATQSQDIETSAYAVLSILISGGNAADVLPIIQYITQNMNTRGGFYSTQVFNFY